MFQLLLGAARSMPANNVEKVVLKLALPSYRRHTTAELAI